ncbi:MAG: hypothetical protein QFE16_00365 [Pseudomonadota bacterium]|nr:hypothetical protein [Pseudomonadota bacterium]
MNLNTAIQQINADAADLDSRIASRKEKREDLSSKLSAVQVAIGAVVAEVDRVRADLSTAYSSGDPFALAEARKQVASASDKAAQGAGLEIEAQALQSAIASIDAECVALGQQLRECAAQAKTVRLSRVRELAADLSSRQRQAAQAFAMVSADAAVLSVLAHGAGGADLEFGPTNLPPFDMQSVGAGFLDRARFVVDPGALVQGRLDAILATLRSEGFEV